MSYRTYVVIHLVSKTGKKPVRNSLQFVRAKCNARASIYTCNEHIVMAMTTMIASILMMWWIRTLKRIPICNRQQRFHYDYNWVFFWFGLMKLIVSVTIQESELSCNCISWVSTCSFSTIGLLNFGTVPIVLYFWWGVKLNKIP